METGRRVVSFLSKRKLMSKRNVHGRSSSSVMDISSVDSFKLPVAAGEQSADEVTVASFFRLLKNHAIEEIDIQCFTPTATISFPNMSTSIEEFCSEMESILRSFPNYSISFGTISEVRPGIVVVEDVVATGTHSGASYSFGPFPPVAKSHRTVRNDPERYEFMLDKNHRITHCRVRCRDQGALSGPAGFYEQVGGFPCL